MREIKAGDRTTISFIHITDTHLLDSPDGKLKGVNTLDSFTAILNESLLHHPEADFILLTGDLSQHGSKESYELLETALHACKLPVYAVPGNHDIPELLNQVIPASPTNGMKIVKLHNVSLILLNSRIANENSGAIDQAQIEQLEDYLASSDSELSIIAIHHPPVSINSKWLDELGLRNRDEVMDVLSRHGHNILLLCGHIHQEVDRQIGNIRLLATPSTCFQFTPGTDHAQIDDMPRPAYRYIELDTYYQAHTQIRSITWGETFGLQRKIQSS